VGCIVIADNVNFFLRWRGCRDELEKLNPFLMAMFGHAGSEDTSVQHVQSGKEGRRAIALVIMGQRLAATLLEGSPG